MKRSSSKFASLLVFLGASLCIPHAGLAQSDSAQAYPSKNVSFVVTYPPGSVVDIAARIISSEIEPVLGETVIVENKPGADTAIAYEYVATRQPADGHTFVLSFVQGWASLPLLGQNLRFDPLKDLIPVMDIAESRLIMGSASVAAQPCN